MQDEHSSVFSKNEEKQQKHVQEPEKRVTVQRGSGDAGWRSSQFWYFFTYKCSDSMTLLYRNPQIIAITLRSYFIFKKF